MLSRKTAVYKASYAADLAIQRVFLARVASATSRGNARRMGNR